MKCPKNSYLILKMGHFKYIFHMLFWTFHNTSRTRKEPLGNIKELFIFSFRYCSSSSCWYWKCIKRRWMVINWFDPVFERQIWKRSPENGQCKYAVYYGRKFIWWKTNGCWRMGSFQSMKWYNSSLYPFRKRRLVFLTGIKGPLRPFARPAIHLINPL